MRSVSPTFDHEFRKRLRELFAWRRDVRRFRADPLPPGTLDRLLEIASSAPSVGLSQPWRFVVVDAPMRRAAMKEEFQACNAEALAGHSGDSAAAYAKLKLAGLDEAPCHLAVFADRETSVGRGLGRRTMPKMAEYSTVTAIYTIWLLARAEGIGMGWVSILDPQHVVSILDVPRDWRFIGYFCLGYPIDLDDTPELEREGWETRRQSADFLLQR